LKTIKAAGGLVYRKLSSYESPEILMIFRRNVWDLPKGKLEEGESIEECAIREVAEEIGIDERPHIVTQLEETYHEYERNDMLFGKTTYWYAMQLSVVEGIDFHPQKEEQIEKVAWQSLAKAKEIVGYENLKDVLISFEGWLDNHNQAFS